MKFNAPACGFAAALTLTISPAAFAESQYYADMNVLSVNKLAPHAARLTDSNSAFVTNLDGTWQFFYCDDHHNLPAFDKIAFSTIQVPGNWERQGHGTAIYVNQEYEFASYKPQPPSLPNAIPVGVYKRTINIPDAWKDRDVVLHVGAAKSGMTVYVNGKEVGYSEDSKNTAEFLLNEYLKPGDNELILKIMRWSTGSYLECQDFWRVSGIERSVALYALPKVRVADYAVTSTLDDSYTDGRFALKLKIANSGAKAVNSPVSYSLTDNNGNVVASATSKNKIAAGETIDAVFSDVTINNVKKWSAETPNLYNLTITVGDDVTRCKVGFRRIEFSNLDAHNRSNRVLLFNGEPIKFKGVNIHEHDAKTGHYVSEADMLRDFTLMKENNINAVRCCHYPQSDRFYELCDSMGIYVYDEANIESHGMGYDLRKGATLGNNPDWLAAHIDRTRNMFERNKNHASVTIWSLGNEAGNGYNFYETYKWLKEADKDIMARPVVYERAQWEWNTDMFVPQYPDTRWLKYVGENGTDRPVVMSEYAHAMGNSGGGIARQWDQINSFVNLQGGFIWDWIDQGFEEKDENGTVYYTYGGDYGNRLPNSGNFNCNGIVNPDRDPHPGMTEVKYAYQNVGFELADDGVIKLTNRNYFTDIDDNYSVLCTVLENGEITKMQYYNVNIAPQASTRITAPAIPSGADGLINVCVVRKSDHNVIASEQFQITNPTFNVDNTNVQGANLTLNTKDADAITVKSDDVLFVINRKNGCVTDYSVKGINYVADNFGPRANYWRGPNDNDYGFGNPKRAQAWKEASAPTNDAKVSAKMQGDVAVVTVTRELVTGCTSTITYNVYKDGAVRIDTELSAANGEVAAMPRNGLRMRLPQTMNNVKYFGRGPGENYSDRNRSTFVGEYATTADDMYYPYVRPQECGHRTDVRRLNLTDANGHGLQITADSLFEFNALRNSIEDFDGEEATNRDYQWYDRNPKELQHDTATVVNSRARRTHINDITPRPFVELCLDEAMQGVGGYDSWGAWPDDDRMVKANQPRRRTFFLRPF
jgi:beta-galactosidase